MNEIALKKHKLAFYASIGALFIGIFAKLSLTKSELLPGLDGAYYWVQARSIIEDQKLAFPDLPLVFWIQALFGKIFDNIPLGVRITDAILPALSAIPIYLLTKNAKSNLLPAVSILVVLIHPIQLYFFTGDFIKNEAAIPLVFFVVLVLTKWETTSRKVSIELLVLLIALISFSHFGTALLAFMIIGIWATIQCSKSGRAVWMKTLGTSLILLTGFLFSLALIVPNRYQRLIDFITTPSVVFQRPILDGMIHGYANSIIAFTIIITQFFVIILGFIAWRNRSIIPFSQLSVIVSSLLSALILSSPFISMEWADRLTALSFVPLTAAAILIVGSVMSSSGKLSTAAYASIILIGALLFSSHPMKRVFTEEKYASFKQLSQQVDLPKNSVIAARHGVEYLTAWHFKTDVVLDTYFEAADLTAYSAVYLLIENTSSDKKIDSSKQGPISKSDEQKAPIESGDKESANGGKETNPSQLGGQNVFTNGFFTLVKIR
jgi:hypothetical protein